MKLLLILLHVAAVSFWLAGALYLPQIFLRHVRRDREEERNFLTLARTIYLGVMTGSGIVAVLLGTALIFRGFTGGWLPVKLALVLLLTAFHLFCGRTLLLLEKHRLAHSPLFYHALTLVPVPLLLAIAGLAVAKPF